MIGATNKINEWIATGEQLAYIWRVRDTKTKGVHPYIKDMQNCRKHMSVIRAAQIL